MRKRFYQITILLIITIVIAWKAPGSDPELPPGIYGNLVNFFENEEDLQRFFEFKKGDVVAEIGAAKGKNIGGLALLTDSLTFYAQDIDAKALTEKNFNRVIENCRKYKNPLTSNFKLCLGDTKASNLPDSAFDKIILSATFHEFEFMDAMLADIHNKLKTDGKLYILESVCLGREHKNYTSDEAIAILGRKNFKLIRKDGKDLNESKGLYRLILSK